MSLPLVDKLFIDAPEEEGGDPVTYRVVHLCDEMVAGGLESVAWYQIASDPPVQIDEHNAHSESSAAPMHDDAQTDHHKQSPAAPMGEDAPTDRSEEACAGGGWRERCEFSTAIEVLSWVKASHPRMYHSDVATELRRGARCLVEFDDGEWYEGIVTGRGAHAGRFAVTFDDGSTDATVRLDEIRRAAPIDPAVWRAARAARAPSAAVCAAFVEYMRRREALRLTKARLGDCGGDGPRRWTDDATMRWVKVGLRAGVSSRQDLSSLPRRRRESPTSAPGGSSSATSSGRTTRSRDGFGTTSTRCAPPPRRRPSGRSAARRRRRRRRLPTFSSTAASRASSARRRPCASSAGATARARSRPRAHSRRCASYTRAASTYSHSE